MRTKQVQFFLPHTFKTHASLHAGMPGTVFLCRRFFHTVVQLVHEPCLSSWPQRFAATVRTSTAAVRLLFYLFAEIVSFILALVVLVSYDTQFASVAVRDESTTALETDGVSEGP